MAQESDSERMQNAPSRAFDRVVQELILPTAEAAVALREAFISVANEGHWKAVRTLEKAWPANAQWPQGEAYLRSIGWRSLDEFGDDESASDDYVDTYDGPELMELLFHRLLYVSYRLFRDPQVRGLLNPQSLSRSRYYTHACINQYLDIEKDYCNQGIDKIVSIQEGLDLMEQLPHDHPACRCSVDPFHATDSDKARIASLP